MCLCVIGDVMHGWGSGMWNDLANDGHLWTTLGEHTWGPHFGTRLGDQTWGTKFGGPHFAEFGDQFLGGLHIGGGGSAR